MASLIVLIHHSGEWDSANNFVHYSMEGMVITTDIDFNRFTRLISSHLNKGLGNFKDYPFCITWKAIDIHHTLSINGKEYGEVNTEIIAHGNTNTYNLNVIEYNDMVAREIVYFQQCNIIESDVANVPLEGQLYKDKEDFEDYCTWKLKCSALHKSKIFKVRRFITFYNPSPSSNLN
ncbi:hypothetical protein R3W88_027277 [Solanum pinnatisectum]|uniref:Uncharacterized protein n=1 Tax=Solanum pinnatisectum TaxID=50273 RepID=A0AAV9LGU9_9SOLN|nr:hypothetical protein R3W88_027277 [Solanum pinnatisectum]